MGTYKKRGNYENYQFNFFFYLRSSIISIIKNILPYFEENKFIINYMSLYILIGRPQKRSRPNMSASGQIRWPTFTLFWP
jgi:hypothetical protein